MHAYARWTFAGLMAFALAGCPGKQPLPIDATKAALSISDNTDGLADGVAQAASFVGASATVSSVNQTCTTKLNPDGTSSSTCTATPVDTTKPTRDAANWLKQHVFNTEHLSSQLSTSTAAVFCLAAADVCSSDAKCVSGLTEVPVCFKVQSFTDGEYEIGVLVGASQGLNPANVTLRQDYLKLETRLSDARAAYLAFSDATGATLPVSFPTRLEGRYEWELEKHSDKVLSLKTSVLDAVAVDVYPATDARHFEIRLAASPSLSAITFDGDQKQLDASVDLKAIDLLVAAQSIFGTTTTCIPPVGGTCPTPTTVSGNVLLHLDGMSYTSLFDAATAEETLSVKNIGLGNSTSKLQYSDQGAVSDLMKVDLNASLGRRVEVTYTQLPSLKGAAVKAISSISLTGTGASVLFPTGKDEVKIEAGTLELDASGMIGQTDVHIQALPNQCLLKSATTPPADSHPFAAWASGACAP